MSKNIEAILSMIDEVLPPEDHPIIEGVHEIIQPQLELITELSGLPEYQDSTYDTHHLFWRRADYKTRLEKTFRRAFQIPILRSVHETVHHEIRPPQKPPRHIMLGYIAILEKKENTD